MADTVNRPMNVLELLDDMTFPASKQEVIQYAQDHDASEDILDELQAMPGENYQTLQDVDRQFGLVEDLPGSENLWSSSDSKDLPDDQEIAATHARGQGRL